jgi:hypothetical protein
VYLYGHLSVDLHKINKRATPNQILLYKHALLLFKLYNCVCTTMDWVHLNFQQIWTSRQLNFIVSHNNAYKIGYNSICNRLTLLNNLIPLSWFALTFNSFKLKCKDKFLWCSVITFLLFYIFIINKMYVIFFEMYFVQLNWQ